MGLHSLRFSITLTAFFLSISSLAGASPAENNCVYTFYVKTGSVIKGGTDSKISVTVGDSEGQSVAIPNLEAWGLMGPKHDYFERDSVDVFSGRGGCMGGPICRMNLTSDGAGAHHGWFCEYVEVTTTGPHRACSQTAFYVDQWLATDAPPFQLTALIDGCGDWSSAAAKRVVVSPRKPSAANL